MAPQPAFHQMLVDALPRLRAYAMILTRSRAAADDLLQETAFRALRAETQFTMGTNFLGWMYRILRNEHISSLRRSKHTPRCIDDIPEDLFARRGDQEEKLLAREVLGAMDKLPASQREVLVLVCAGGMSYDAAAASIGCSVGTVKSRLWRARQHMQELVLGREQAEVTHQAAADVETEAETDVETEAGFNLPNEAVKTAEIHAQAL